MVANDHSLILGHLLPLLRTVLPIDLIVHAHRVVRVEVILFEAELALSTVPVHARERWRRHPREIAQVTERHLHLAVEYVAAGAESRRVGIPRAGVRTSRQVAVDEVPRLSIIIFDSQLAKRRILDLQSVAPCKEVAAIQQLQCLRCFRRLRELDHRLEDRLILLERHDLLDGAVSGKDRVEHFDAHWVHQIDHMNKENLTSRGSPARGDEACEHYCATIFA